jgi:hypothetical protein
MLARLRVLSPQACCAGFREGRPENPMRNPIRSALALIVLGATGCMMCGASAQAAAPRDWKWVQGAVFVPTNCVNEAQQWDEYDPAVNDRELHYASVYGINVVRVYLHYFVYLKKRDALLADIEDFLSRADRYGIKTEFVFFDDCWNQPPQDILSAGYRYPAPLPGVHNSRWLVCPGEEVRTHYEKYRPSLKAYVQDIVGAHRNDPRVAFWEIYNEPNHSEATVRLERDAAAWIRETGTPIPATATGLEFSGGPFSDFLSWHEYGAYKVLGGAESLCTECMNREGQSVPGIVRQFGGRVGYIFWEFGIGRDNCRFAWGDKPGKPRKDEAPIPFHGIVYPDGHPWSLDDARALLGVERFSRTPFFNVRYYRDDMFSQLAKASVTPMIDFDLGNEAGTGSPDASAGVPLEHFSVLYTGAIRAPADGLYTFSIDHDGTVQMEIGDRRIAGMARTGRKIDTGAVSLSANRSYPIELRYTHATGPSSLHLRWSGAAIAERVVEPVSGAGGL